MAYNKEIAVITGQDSICHEILYDIRNSEYGIYKVIGEAGAGKRTLCENIADLWISQNKGNAFYLTASYRQNPEDYSTFKNLIVRNNNEKRLFNIFTDVLKDIPYLGSSLSAIAKEIIEAKNQKANLTGEYEENKKYIFSILKKEVKIGISCFFVLNMNYGI